MKKIGDAVYDCMTYNEISSLISKYIDFYEKPNYKSEAWRMARHKLMRYIMKETCIKSVLRDYEVRYEMPQWRTDYR